MRHLLGTVASSMILATLSSGAALSAEVSSTVSIDSVQGGGRNVMRTADGGIVSAFSLSDSGRPALVFGRSLDNGRSWQKISLSQVNGAVVQVAIDSNFQGSYIAFTEKAGGQLVGRIAYSSAPFGAQPKFIVSDAVTPAGIVPHDTFIQASRAGWGDRADENRKSVVYGWQDASSKALYIGVSADGERFPVAQRVVMDSYAKSGPAVAIRGDYVIATYQTTNPDMAPADVPAELRGQRSYPAWIESLDGGRTWSAPQPLFGLTSSAFPSTGVAQADGSLVLVRLAGGSDLPNSPILNWATSRSLEAAILQPDKTLPIDPYQLDRFPIDGLPTDRFPIERFTRDRLPDEAGTNGLSPLDVPGQRQPPIERPPQTAPGDAPRSDSNRTSMIDPLGGTTFVQSSMRSLDGDGARGEVSIVSFRPIEPGAKWTHVIANNPLTENPAQVDGATSHLTAHGAQFQYSALIDTAVRATTYQEVDPATGRSRLVAAVSTDTGKTFNRHISFSDEDLVKYGISAFDGRSVLAVSQCLFEDRDGEVYVDILFMTDGRMRFASLPLGVNAAKLRAAEQAILASR